MESKVLNLIRYRLTFHGYTFMVANLLTFPRKGENKME